MFMSSIKNHINCRNYINVLLSLIPICFILGNLAINLNVLLVIISSLFFFRFKIFKLKFFFFDKLLIFLSCYILFVALVNGVNYSEVGESYWLNKIMLKSLFFLRYILFYFVIRFLIDQKIFNFKYFLFSASLCAIFVSLDLILQFSYGKDVFGYPKSDYKLSGPFGDELIAGAYLQRFSIFIFFLISFFYKPQNKKLKIFVIFSFFIIIFFSIIITGNRMPIILFILLFGLLFLIEKKLRSYFVILIPMICLVFLISYNLMPRIQDFTISFFSRINEFYIFLIDVAFHGNEPKMTNRYLNEFYSGYSTWKLNPVIGGGIDSFYFNCSKIVPFCNSHPHNYYLEILSELGIIGFVLILLILIKLFQIIYMKKIYLIDSSLNRLITPFLLLLLVEIFPFKSTGSFFTTTNTTFIFFLLAVIIGLSRLNTIDLNIKNK